MIKSSLQDILVTASIVGVNIRVRVSQSDPNLTPAISILLEDDDCASLTHLSTPVHVAGVTTASVGYKVNTLVSEDVNPLTVTTAFNLSLSHDVPSHNGSGIPLTKTSNTLLSVTDNTELEIVLVCSDIPANRYTRMKFGKTPKLDPYILIVFGTFDSSGSREVWTVGVTPLTT